LELKKVKSGRKKKKKKNKWKRKTGPIRKVGAGTKGKPHEKKYLR